MKTKALVFLLALLGFSPISAQNTVNLQGGRDDITCGHIKEMPIVTYTSTCVSVKSKVYIGNVKIVIKDIHGNIIYNKVVDLLPDTNVLDIPEEYVSDKFTIELSYDTSKLYGYFLYTNNNN